MHSSTRLSARDVFFFTGIILFFLPFFLSQWLLQQYHLFTGNFVIISSFAKFAVLATLGEVIGLRIKTGQYNQPGFGILPRALVWGFLGLTIQMAFVIFSTGTPVFLEYAGMKGVAGLPADTGLTWLQVFVAFSISMAMNLIYAPVMMTVHKITDTHIEMTGGTLRGLFTAVRVGDIMANINWRVQWSFVFKKTIPLFWIPAHTITFLLPEAYRVLFAALLGIMLGVILAVAAVMGKQN